MRKKTLIISCLLAGTLGLSSCNALIYKIYHTHSYEDGDESVLYVDGEWYQYCTICGGIGDVVTNTTGYTHVVEDAEGLTAAFKFSGTTALISNITLTSALSVASGMAIELNLNYYDLTLSDGMVIDGDLVITSSALRTETSNPIESEDEEGEEAEELEELDYLDHYDIVTYADDDEPDDDGDDDPDIETEPGPVEEPVPAGGAEEITVSGQGIIVNSTGTLGVIDNVLIDTTDCSNLITVNGGLINLYSGQISSEIDGETTDECAINVTNSGTLNVIGGEIEADDIGVLADGSASITVSSGSVDGSHAGIVTDGESGSTTITLTGGSISSSEGSGIVTRESEGAVEISIYGLDTTIDAPAGAGLLLLNENCTASVISGYINGLTGAEIHAGALTVNGENTYIIGNGLFSDVRYEYNDVEKTFASVEEYEVDSDTNYVCGCGVAIVREEADISVTINGGNIIAGDNLEYALYLNEEEEKECGEMANRINEVITPTISLIVNDGFFYGKLSVSLSGFIYGGTFAETGYTDAETFNGTGYIAEDHEAVELNGYYVVGEASDGGNGGDGGNDG